MVRTLSHRTHRTQSATSLLSLLFLLSLTRDNAINILVIPRRGNREACEQEVSPMPRRGDLPLFMGDAEREGSVSARVLNKGRWPQNCMIPQPYQQGLRVQFFAMTVYKKTPRSRDCEERILSNCHPTTTSKGQLCGSRSRCSESWGYRSHDKQHGKSTRSWRSYHLARRG